jgi:hypothetical protein
VEGVLLLMAKKKTGLKKWFSQNNGKGWIDCKTGKACGRKSAKGGSKRPYPACRPTKAACTKKGTSAKKGPARVSWKSKKK